MPWERDQDNETFCHLCICYGRGICIPQTHHAFVFWSSVFGRFICRDQFCFSGIVFSFVRVIATIGDNSFRIPVIKCWGEKNKAFENNSPLRQSTRFCELTLVSNHNQPTRMQLYVMLVRDSLPLYPLFISAVCGCTPRESRTICDACTMCADRKTELNIHC